MSKYRVNLAAWKSSLQPEERNHHAPAWGGRPGGEVAPKPLQDRRDSWTGRTGINSWIYWDSEDKTWLEQSPRRRRSCPHLNRLELVLRARSQRQKGAYFPGLHTWGHAATTRLNRGELRELKTERSLLFPARLRVRHKGQFKVFCTSDEEMSAVITDLRNASC